MKENFEELLPLEYEGNYRDRLPYDFSKSERVNKDESVATYVNGEIYDYYPLLENVMYKQLINLAAEAHYWIIDGKKYDMYNTEDILSIPVTDFPKRTEKPYDEECGLSNYSSSMLRQVHHSSLGSRKVGFSLLIRKVVGMEEESVTGQPLFTSDVGFIENAFRHRALMESYYHLAVPLYFKYANFLHYSGNCHKDDFRYIKYRLFLMDEEKQGDYLYSYFEKMYLTSKDALDEEMLNHYKNMIEECKEDGIVEITSPWNNVCEICCPYANRIYSLGKPYKKYPLLPERLYSYNNMCDGEKCRFSASYAYGKELSVYGEKYDAEEISLRPYTDTRTQQEKIQFDSIPLASSLEDQFADETSDVLRVSYRNGVEYQLLLDFLPDLAPKSKGGYSRMRNMRSKNFLTIQTVAKNRGINIG